ncbi:Glycine receptor subunit alpha-3 [Mactra antiquata]
MLGKRYTLESKMKVTSTAILVRSVVVAMTTIIVVQSETPGKSKTDAGTSNWTKIDGERQKTLDNLLKNYDSRIPPNYEEDFPVKVEVQLHITNIDSISESNMEYKFGAFLRQKWNDTRLRYTRLPRLRSLELDAKTMDQVWVPDLFMANEKEAHFHTVTVPNKLMHIYPDGGIHYSVRISATLKCDMDLRKYPMDSQECSVIMESYGYSTENLEFVWNASPVMRDPSLRLAQFYLGKFNTGRCDKVYLGVKYTCIELKFKMVRSLGYYLIQVYVPSILIVILSWVSFWLDKDAVPARISLGLLTVLTMTTMTSGARSSLPKVSYVKGMDVWMATCLIFVFAALIEFAYVNVFSRVGKRRQHESSKSEHGGQATLEAMEILTDADGQVLCPKKKSPFNMFLPSPDKARTFDRISRIAFPAVFLTFNVIYWFVYVFWIPGRETDE